MNGRKVSLGADGSRSFATLRAASSWVTSHSSTWVTAGMIRWASLIRWAIVRRTPRRGSRRSRDISPGVPGAASAGSPEAPAGNDSPASPERSTSARVIRPPGPVPSTSAMSTPSSRASLRTGGVALTGRSLGAGAGAARGASAPMVTSTAPTAAMFPSGTCMRATTPAKGDGISAVALSVITSTSGSSSAISSPSFTNQRSTSASVTPSPRSGSKKSGITASGRS